MDGLGASSADFLDSLTRARADFFFTPAGIGLSILRTQIIPDLATCNAEFREGGCSNSNGQVLNGELGTAQLAVARGAIVFGTPWSPPGAHKSNGSFKNGGFFFISPYFHWANELPTHSPIIAHTPRPLYPLRLPKTPNFTTHSRARP